MFFSFPRDYDDDEKGSLDAEVDHQERGMTRIFGMAASTAGEFLRILPLEA